MIFDKKNHKIDLICCSSNGQIDLQSSVIEKFKKMISIEKIAAGTMVGVAIASMAYTGYQVSETKSIYDKFEGKFTQEKITPKDAKSMLGPESSLIAMRFDIDNSISSNHVVIDTKDSNLSIILGSLDDSFIVKDKKSFQLETLALDALYSAGGDSSELDAMKSFNMLTDKKSPPKAITRRDNGVSVCYMVGDVNVKSSPSEHNISGVKMDFTSIESRVAVKNHEEAHCLDLSGNPSFKREFFADIATSMINASVTGNFDMAKNFLIPLRALRPDDPNHQSSLEIQKMIDNVNPKDLYGMPEHKVIQYAKDYFASTEINKEELIKFGERSGKLSLVDGNHINEKTDDVYYKGSVRDSKTGGSYLTDIRMTIEQKIEIAEHGRKLLQIMVNKALYDGTFGTPESNLSILNMSSKIAKLDGDTSAQYQIRYETILAENGEPSKIDFALNANKVSVNYELVGRRDENSNKLEERERSLDTALGELRKNEYYKYIQEGPSELTDNKRANRHNHNEEMSFGM